MTVIDEILERYKNLQYLRIPQDMIALKAIAEILREHGYVTITESLYANLCVRPIWTTGEAVNDDTPGP